MLEWRGDFQLLECFLICGPGCPNDSLVLFSVTTIPRRDDLPPLTPESAFSSPWLGAFCYYSAVLGKCRGHGWSIGHQVMFLIPWVWLGSHVSEATLTAVPPSTVAYRLLLQSWQRGSDSPQGQRSPGLSSAPLGPGGSDGPGPPALGPVGSWRARVSACLRVCVHACEWNEVESYAWVFPSKWFWSAIR